MTSRKWFIGNEKLQREKFGIILKKFGTLSRMARTNGISQIVADMIYGKGLAYRECYMDLSSGDLIKYLFQDLFKCRSVVYWNRLAAAIS